MTVFECKKIMVLILSFGVLLIYPQKVENLKEDKTKKEIGIINNTNLSNNIENGKSKIRKGTIVPKDQVKRDSSTEFDSQKLQFKIENGKSREIITNE